MDKYGNKTGGRKKGTPNRSSLFSKELINEILGKYHETGKLKDDFDRVEPKERLNIAVKLMSFVVPQMKATTLEVGVDEKQATLAEKLKELGRQELLK